VASPEQADSTQAARNGSEIRSERERIEVLRVNASADPIASAVPRFGKLAEG
jgi:hypothetical protein